MSESGCLHNNKYESVEVENHIESNEYTVTEEFHVKSYQMSGDDGGKLQTAVMYSCGDGHGRYNVHCHTITSNGIGTNKTAEGVDMAADQPSLDAYNNYFVGVTDPVKKSDGKIDFTNEQPTYKGFVEWPANSILYDLTIIPSKDIQTTGPVGAYGSGVGGTTVRNSCEIVVNLFTVNTTTDVWEQNTNLSPNIQSAGPLHKGRYSLFDKSSFLIREFPIVASPPGTTPASKSRWFKHTPLCVVREGGLPMEIVKPNSTVFHQHSTSSTGADPNVAVIKHGSEDTYTDTIPTGKGDDTSAINRSNTGPSGEPWTNFAFNNIQRRKGTADRNRKKTLIKDFDAFTSVEKSRSKMGQFYNHSQSVGLMLNIGSNNTPLAVNVGPPSGVSVTDTQGTDDFKTLTITEPAGLLFANIQFKAIFTFKKL